MIKIKSRLLFFDLLRIGCIAAIVCDHLIHLGCITLPGYLEFLGVVRPYFGGAFWLSLGNLGVYGLIFVSGAVLAFTHPKVDNLFEFFKRRLIRLYPVVWMSLVVALLITPTLITSVTVRNWILSIIGMTIYAGEWGGPINPILWFIGLIVALYLLYPFIARFIDKSPHVAMGAMILISVLSTFVIVYFNLDPSINGPQCMPRWLFLCNRMEFGFGVYIVKMGIYPKITYTNPAISYLAELSFCIFLFEYILIGIGLVNLGLYFFMLFVISAAALNIDKQIQQKFKHYFKVSEG